MTATTNIPAADRRGRRAADRSLWVGPAIVSLVTLALAAGGWSAYWWAFQRTYHYMPVDPGKLYRSGNRDVREFGHAVQQSGAKTVVCLADDRELDDPAKPQFKAEADYCRAHGIRWVHIPVPLGGWPTREQINQFLGVVAIPADRPVLVHCAQGVRRTGMFVAAYQLSVLDRSKPYARSTVQAFGHGPQDTDDVRTFIDRYDPAMGPPTSMPAATPEQ